MGFTPDLVTGCWVGGEEPSIHFRTLALGRGGYMALPITGKFFNKLYHDPAFASFKEHNFPELDESTLAKLDIPHFAESIKQKKKGSLWGIFGGGDSKKNETKSENTIRKKEGNNDDELKKSKLPEKEEKLNIWQKIKNALKKRD